MVLEELLYVHSESKERLPNVFFVFEGAVTEPFFIKKYLDYLRDYLFDEINVILVEKTGKDEGRTEIKELIKIAKEITKKASFDKNIDKVVVMFDLDRFENDQNRINTLLSKIEEGIVFAYTNPSFELFVFLLIKDSLDKLLFPNKERILNNEWVNISGEEKERFIVYLLKNTIGINTKNQKQLEEFDYSNVFENFDYAAEQEQHINSFLDCSANNLTSNICLVLEKIKAKKTNDIIYESLKKGGQKP